MEVNTKDSGMERDVQLIVGLAIDNNQHYRRTSTAGAATMLALNMARELT